MPDFEPTDSLERPEESHTVIRREPFIRQWKPIEGDFLIEADLGQPSDEKTFGELEHLAQNIVDTNTSLQLEQIDESTLQKVADAVGDQFPFKFQSLGIGTLPKQLEYYKAHPDSQRADGLDCKLATVMSGLVLKKLAAQNNHDIQVCLTTKHQKLGPHPSLLISAGTANYTLDSHVIHDEKSVITVRPVSAAVLERCPIRVPLNLEGLIELDNAFLND